jgi:hypothetical protein
MKSIIIPYKCLFNCLLTLLEVIDPILAFQAIATLGAYLAVCKAFTIQFQTFALLAIALEL